MEYLDIRIEEKQGLLVLTADTQAPGSQFDDNARILRFSRPQRCAEQNLILCFSDGRQSFLPVHLGKANEYPIPNALTAGTRLIVQARFEQEGRTEHTDRLELALRPSLGAGGKPVESWPDPLRELRQSAFAEVTQKNDRLSFYNAEGGELGSAVLTGGEPHSPYLGENGTWHEWNSLTASYDDTGVFARGGAGERGPQGPKGDPGPSGDAELVTRSLVMEGSRSVRLPNTADIPARLASVQAGGSAAGPAELIITNRNLLDMAAISTGKYAGITVSKDEATGEITVSGDAYGVMRVKLTGGFAATREAMPAAWRTQRLDFAGERTYVSVSDFARQNSIYSECSLGFAYADGSASTMFTYEAASAKSGFLEAQTPAGKEICCVFLYLSWYGEQTFRLKPMRSAEAIGSGANFVPSRTQRAGLPALPALGAAHPDAELTLLAGGLARVQGDKPYRLVFTWQGRKPRGITEKSFGAPGPPAGLYTAPADAVLPRAELAAMTYEELISRYDALMALAPSYITKRAAGLSSGGKTLYSYRFSPVRPGDPAQGGQTKLPKLTFTAGVHGDERSAWAALYLMLRRMVTDWKSDPVLEHLRFHAELAVMPLVNPSMGRLNPDGVNVNRNFYPNWESSAESGSAPLSAPEAKAVYDFLLEHSDSDFHFDLHNLYENEPAMFDVYMAGADGSGAALDGLGREIQNVCAPASLAVWRSWQRRHEQVLGGAYDTARVNAGLSPWNVGKTVTAQARALGLAGATLETRRRFTEMPGSADHDGFAQRMALEHTANAAAGVLAALAVGAGAGSARTEAALSFSEQERATGARWLDGAEIYEKTLRLPPLPNAASLDIPAGIADMGMLISLDGVYDNGYGMRIPANYPSAHGGVVTQMNGAMLRVTTASDRSAFTNNFVTLRYTKSAGAFS